MDAGIAIVNETSKWSRAKLGRIVSEPLRAAAVKCAVALGSYARGVAGTQSDLDLVVVVESDRSRLERARLLSDSCDALPVPGDILVFTPDEFELGIQTGLDVVVAVATGRIDVFPIGRVVK